MASDEFILSFVPEHLYAVDRLKLFPSGKVKYNKLLLRGINTVSDHFKKIEVLVEIANEIIPKLQIDQYELKKRGCTPAKYSRQLSAIIECCITELYASLDGMRDVIFAAYGDLQDVQKKSTGKLFERAQNNAYGDGFPPKLQRLLSDAYGNWFTTLRNYRTELTHYRLGSCHFNPKAKKSSICIVILERKPKHW